MAAVISFSKLNGCFWGNFHPIIIIIIFSRCGSTTELKSRNHKTSTETRVDGITSGHVSVYINIINCWGDLTRISAQVYRNMVELQTNIHFKKNGDHASVAHALCKASVPRRPRPSIAHAAHVSN